MKEDIEFENIEDPLGTNPEVPRGWNSWFYQKYNRIRSIKELQKIFNMDNIPDLNLPVSITPYYLEIAKKHLVLLRTIIPTPDELKISPNESNDPLCEDKFSPVHGIVHRYPDRVLFLVSNTCAVNCRYCTRSRIIGKEDDFVSMEQIDNCLKYIRKNKQIRDVLLSGGDPLTLRDDTLYYILSKLKEIKHVEIIRIGTKIPVVAPQRVNDRLVDMLKLFHPLYINIHFTHPAEITLQCKEACERLANAGIPLGSQTVLLKNINDNLETMKLLMRKLLMIRVKPYYIYQCDSINGSSHFKTSIETGLEIMKGLRWHMTGFGVPTYVIDAPQGGGKIPITEKTYEIIDGRVKIKNALEQEFVY
jgi:lysine 2,3-aminomutase